MRPETKSATARPGLIARLARQRSGTVGMVFALAAVPTIMAIGAAVDYARLEQFKSQLQALTDSAALSGAAVYVDTTQNTNAKTVATNFMTSNVKMLPGYIGTITPTITATQVTTGGNQGYTVTVQATAKINTTVMKIVASTLSVSATSVAVNPQVQITMSMSGFKSSAGDANTLWYWLPTTSNLTAVPTVSGFASNQKLASNTSTSNPNVTITATATQKIGVALENVTGGNTGYYGCTQYQTASGYTTQSQCYLHTQWFFSNIFPPSDNSYNLSGYKAVTKDCSILTSISATAPTVITPPSSGSCLTAQPTDALFSCSDLNGQYITQYWNDMGWTTDDLDYNDAEITISCSGITGTGNAATNVYLAQ